MENVADGAVPQTLAPRPPLHSYLRKPTGHKCEGLHDPGEPNADLCTPDESAAPEA